jgi:hypothetical protein
MDEKNLMFKVREFVKFKRAISNGKKDLKGHEEEIVNEVTVKLLEGETLEHALENGFNAHLRFTKSRGTVYVDEYYEEKISYKSYEKLLAKDIRLISYKNFWRSFCKHPHSFQTILSILDGHDVAYRVNPSQSERIRMSITLLKDCPTCGKYGDFQICLNDKGLYFGKCICTQRRANPANIGNTLALALDKPYSAIKEYIYTYLQDDYRSPH